MEAVRRRERSAVGKDDAGKIVAGAVRMKRKRSRKTSSSGQGKRNKELGRRGEEAAVQFLARRGYDILERNWECFAGEADIVARDGDVLVFVEVKTRSDLSMGFPSEAVTKEKRERYEKIACAYVADRDVTEMMLRFDVVAVVVVDAERLVVRHHINAFSAESLS